MTNASQPNSLLQGFLPSGRRVSLNLVADDLATLIQLTLEADSLMTASGITVREPGLNEPGMQRYTIDTVARRSIVDTRTGEETSIIDFYCNNPGMTFRVVFAYLNTPEQTADFEQASGLRVSDIPLYEGDKIERGASSKTDKYLAKTNLFDIVLKPNPRHDPKEEDPKKKKPKNLLAFIVGGNPAVWDRGGNTNVDFSRLAPPMNGTGNGHNGTNRNTGDLSGFQGSASQPAINGTNGLNSVGQQATGGQSSRWIDNEDEIRKFAAAVNDHYGFVPEDDHWFSFPTARDAFTAIRGAADREQWSMIATSAKYEKMRGSNASVITLNTDLPTKWYQGRTTLAQTLGFADDYFQTWENGKTYELPFPIVVTWEKAGDANSANGTYRKVTGINALFAVPENANVPF